MKSPSGITGNPAKTPRLPRLAHRIAPALALATAISLTLVLIPFPASASITVVGTNSGSATSPPALSTTYPVLDADNFGGTGPFTYDGVVFTARTVTAASGAATEETSPFTITIGAVTGSVGVASFGSGAYSPLFETEIDSNAPSTQMLTISGLNPTFTYEFQILHGDTRGFAYNDAQTLTDNLSDNVSAPLVFDTTTSNQYVDLIVDASGITSFTCAMPVSSVRGPSYSGLVISGVPEPGSATLLSLTLPAVAALFRPRRLRRSSFGVDS